MSQTTYKPGSNFESESHFFKKKTVFFQSNLFRTVISWIDIRGIF